MAQLLYNEDLAGQVEKSAGPLSRKPLRRWRVSPVKAGLETRYLYVEENTGLPVFTSTLGPFEFEKTINNLLNETAFLVDSQRKWLMVNVFDGNLYMPAPDAKDQTLKAYLKTIAKHQDEFEEKFKDNSALIDIVDMLLGYQGTHDQVFGKFRQLVNEEHPVNVTRPRSNAKYCTVKPNFEDPRKWQADEGKPVDGNEAIVKAIAQNNSQMIKQFIATAPAELDEAETNIYVDLERFLNDFLLRDRIQLVTTNLADANAFFVEALDYSDEDLLFTIIEQFYTFLSRTGIVTQAAANHVAAYMERSYRVLFGNLDNVDIEKINDIAQDNDKVDDFFQQLFDNQEKSAPNLQAGDANRRLINPQNYDQEYVISVHLADYKPRMSREFAIKGSSTIKELAEAVILMFNGGLVHLYDVINEQTKEIYTKDDEMLPAGMTAVDMELATVSLLNKKDKLKVHYDYGDDWEFDLRVLKIIPATDKDLPQVQKAKGYGIIEDIGGTGALRQYHEDFQKGQLGPDILEWMANDPIDLDKVDVDELNGLIGYGSLWD